MATAKVIQISDFEDGEYSLPERCFSDLQFYLDRYEARILKQLLGAELYSLFIADIPSVGAEPDTQRFKDIYNPICEDDGCVVRDGEGMVQMLVQFCYFYAVRDLNVKKTSSGVVMNQNEVSQPLKGFNNIEAFNDGVENAWTIQWLIHDNPTVYPEENMQVFTYTTIL